MKKAFRFCSKITVELRGAGFLRDRYYNTYFFRLLPTRVYLLRYDTHTHTHTHASDEQKLNQKKKHKADGFLFFFGSPSHIFYIYLSRGVTVGFRGFRGFRCGYLNCIYRIYIKYTTEYVGLSELRRVLT